MLNSIIYKPKYTETLTTETFDFGQTDAQRIENFDERITYLWHNRQIICAFSMFMFSLKTHFCVRKREISELYTTAAAATTAATAITATADAALFAAADNNNNNELRFLQRCVSHCLNSLTALYDKLSS